MDNFPKPTKGKGTPPSEPSNNLDKAIPITTEKTTTAKFTFHQKKCSNRTLSIEDAAWERLNNYLKRTQEGSRSAIISKAINEYIHKRDIEQ